MKLSEKFTHRHLTIVALAVGVSVSLYATAETTPAMDATTKVVTQTTTTVVKHKHHHRAHMAMHKARHAAEHHSDAMSNAKALDAQAANGMDAAQSDASPDTTKRVIWKNGVIYHEVEPTGQATNGEFGAPTSTSDTLEGGVTTTLMSQ